MPDYWTLWLPTCWIQLPVLDCISSFGLCVPHTPVSLEHSLWSAFGSNGFCSAQTRARLAVSPCFYSLCWARLNTSCLYMHRHESGCSVFSSEIKQIGDVPKMLTYFFKLLHVFDHHVTTTTGSVTENQLRSSARNCYYCVASVRSRPVNVSISQVQ